MPRMGGFSDDAMCVVGADNSSGPAALLRGGSWSSGVAAAVFTVVGTWPPSGSTNAFGFRCAR